MKENLVQLVYVLIGVTIVVLLLSDENHTGRYVPFANKMILDTTNGDVYLPTKGKSTKYIWEKYFAFQPKKELQAELNKNNEELKRMNNELKAGVNKEQKQAIETMTMILEVEAEKIQNKLDSMD